MFAVIIPTLAVKLLCLLVLNANCETCYLSRLWVKRQLMAITLDLRVYYLLLFGLLHDTQSCCYCRYRYCCLLLMIPELRVAGLVSIEAGC